MNNKKVLISGSGIAGLTLGISLKEKGWNPVIIEKDEGMRTEGYMMDFFGSGWDVAERMGLIEDIKKERYPIKSLGFLDKEGDAYNILSIDAIKKAFDSQYTYLRRSDLEMILWQRAKIIGLDIRFKTTVTSLKETSSEVTVEFQDGSKEVFDLVFGADGVHSRIRELVFGEEKKFERYLGYYVAAFHLKNHSYDIGTQFKIYEQADRALWVYPLGKTTLDAVYIFRSEPLERIPFDKRISFLREKFINAGWITESILNDVTLTEPVYFDSATQIRLPSWSKGRVAFLGDACACLTLLAGQGSHMAMVEAYVLAQELERHGDDYRSAFETYEKFLKPKVERKQNAAKNTSRYYLPSSSSWMLLRRLFVRILFSGYGIGVTSVLLGLKSVLKKYS